MEKDERVVFDLSGFDVRFGELGLLFGPEDELDPDWARGQQNGKERMSHGK